MSVLVVVVGDGFMVLIIFNMSLWFSGFFAVSSTMAQWNRFDKISTKCAYLAERFVITSFMAYVNHMGE